LVRLRQRLAEPEPVTSPAAGVPSVVGVPTFVAVGNWQGTLTESGCRLGVCVTLTATPTLEFDPGEPGAAVVACDPPGTRFDPDGAEPRAQAAAPGACAHAYHHRTGVGGRPAEWGGEVRVGWAVSWASGPTTGTFDTLVLSASVPRDVDEVTSLVTESRLGAGG
jgi:hypothetical protein